MVDEWTHECLAIDVAGSIRSSRVVDVLARLVSARGAPRHLRCDNGPEFVSKALLRWMTSESIQTAFIDPGKPWQDGIDESFNGRFRGECLGMDGFRTRTEAAVVRPGDGTTTKFDPTRAWTTERRTSSRMI